MKMASNKKIEMVIRCGVQGCCPTVHVSGNKVVLKDDFGNVTRMTKDQWISLAQETVKKI